VGSNAAGREASSRWNNTTLLGGDDPIGAIRQLPDRDGDGGIQAWGSPSLALQLVENDLVDEYWLMLEPILLGGGKTIFPRDGRARPLELVSVTQAKTGVLVCAYRPVAG
jgi:dihydrofolate reductase